MKQFHQVFINRLILWLIFTSRLTNRTQHVVSFGSSGTGQWQRYPIKH